MELSVVMTMKVVSKWKVLRAVLCSAHAKCQTNAVIIMKQGVAVQTLRRPVGEGRDKVWGRLDRSVS